jgi:hypothetical protein
LGCWDMICFYWFSVPSPLAGMTRVKNYNMLNCITLTVLKQDKFLRH